jgi:hypothetical protein
MSCIELDTRSFVWLPDGPIMLVLAMEGPYCLQRKEMDEKGSEQGGKRERKKGKM